MLATNTCSRSTATNALRMIKQGDAQHLDDAVATQDTVTQIISAARRVIASVPAAARAQLSHDYSVPGKPIIDWSLRQERDDLVSALAADATALLDAVAGGELNADQADAVGMLALVSAQDVEPGDQPGHWRIARKVAKDRVISTVDPEARHGHKSVSVRNDGFKAHICIEPDTGIVTAAKLTPANHPDGPAGLELMAGEPEGLEVLAGSAYGSGATRTELKTMGHNLVIKPVPSHPAVPGGLGRDEFNVDHHSRRVTCPAGHVARLPLSGVAKFAPHCSSCPLRARCTNAKARTFSVGPNDAELVAARAAWHGPELTASYRQHRPMAERSISWLVAKGNRRLRYRGVERNDAWLHLRAAALNLRRLLALGLAHDGTWVLANS
jgi:Transposase DDE domain